MSSYHGWTHAPKSRGGTDPIPAPPMDWVWMRRTTDITGIAASTPTAIAAYDSSDVNGSAFTADETNGIITVVEPGLYLAQGWALWSGLKRSAIGTAAWGTLATIWWLA